MTIFTAQVEMTTRPSRRRVTASRRRRTTAICAGRQVTATFAPPSVLTRTPSSPATAMVVELVMPWKTILVTGRQVKLARGKVLFLRSRRGKGLPLSSETILQPRPLCRFRGEPLRLRAGLEARQPLLRDQVPQPPLRRLLWHRVERERASQHQWSGRRTERTRLKNRSII